MKERNYWVHKKKRKPKKKKKKTKNSKHKTLLFVSEEVAI
jgi:hypothetical protein